jgi:hypothetical protein
MSRRLYLVSAYFPPSNLVCVHRARLMANYLQALGWDVTILSVQPDYYEEKLEWELLNLVSPSVRVIRVPAISQKFARSIGIGDIAIRAFVSLYMALKNASEAKQIDLLHITIPSNYQTVLGRILSDHFDIPYIIDYQDPWVSESKAYEKVLSKAWISSFIAERLEPFALSRASGITGITEEYFQGVLHRNPNLEKIPKLEFQMGFSREDYEVSSRLNIASRRIQKNSSELQVVYAGVLLPQAIQPFRCFLKALSIANAQSKRPIRLICLGTGGSDDNPNGYRILPMARDLGAEQWVMEYPERHPYLEILATLSAADGIVVIGSTERHYSPSKIFQSILSERPVLALLHRESDAVSILESSGAGKVIKFDSVLDQQMLIDECARELMDWHFDAMTHIDWEFFNQFDASSNAAKLSKFYEEVLEYHKGHS